MYIYFVDSVSAMVFQGVYLQMCGEVLPFGKRHLRPHLDFPPELRSTTFTKNNHAVVVVVPVTVRNHNT